MERSNKLYGITALFNKPDNVIYAAEKIVEAGYKKFDVNTSYPVHGLESAMSLKDSKVGFVTLFLGFSGTAFILLLMGWMMAINYPIVVGGKPFFAFPAFIPITFEFTVLLGGVSTAIGMIAAFIGMPRESHPLHNTDYMKAVSLDKFGIVIESSDPQFDENKVLEFLKSFNPEKIDKVYFPQEVKYPIFQPRFIFFLIITAVVISALTYLTLNKLMYVVPFNWMDVQAKTDPQQKSAFFTDEFGMRTPVEGTVARGFIPYPFLGNPNPPEPLRNPLLPAKKVLELGRKKFLTFCSPCHGNFAEGNSRLHEQFPAGPSLHTERVRNFSDGYIYNYITNGGSVMPSYQDQITREERWAIIDYVRVLQRATNPKKSDFQEIKKEQSSNAQN
jgi:mono/diheme cytochrome c family protein